MGPESGQRRGVTERGRAVDRRGEHESEQEAHREGDYSGRSKAIQADRFDKLRLGVRRADVA